MFPGAHSQIYYNESGEPLGWDSPGEPPYVPYEDEPDEPDDCDENDEPLE